MLCYIRHMTILWHRLSLCRRLVGILFAAVVLSCSHVPVRRHRSMPQLATQPQQLRIVGRFVREAGGAVRFGWPNTALGTRFVGTELWAWLEDVGESRVGDQRVNNTYDVVVDGLRQEAPLRVVPGTRRYPLAAQLGPGEHSAWLHKRTEGMVGSARFFGFEPGGAEAELLAPPAPRPRQIEVIGASNEAGYGVEASLPRPQSCGFSAATENACSAWPARLAKAFDAELTNLAASGKGVWRSYSGGMGPESTLPALYGRPDPQQSGDSWAFPGPAANLVLVALGGNDFAKGVPDAEAFTAAYATFLIRLQAQHPGAHLMCVLTSMLQPPERDVLQGYIEVAIQRSQQPATPPIQLVALPPYTGTTFGCDGHPDRALQQAMAEQLVPRVAALTGWEVVEPH